MEAAATPFPREETTPPVTKIYFGPLYKALESLRWNRRTADYGGKCGACQITISKGRRKDFELVTHVTAGRDAGRIP